VGVRERTVPRGVGFDLRAVQTDVTQLEQFHFLGHLQELQKRLAQFVKKTPAERRQAVVIGMAAGTNVAEGHRIVGRPLQLATGENTRGVAINQNRQQGRRMVRLRSSSSVLACQLRQVQLFDHLHDEARQVILVQPIVN